MAGYQAAISASSPPILRGQSTPELHILGATDSLQQLNSSSNHALVEEDGRHMIAGKTAKSRTWAPQTIQFIELPAELRNQIYELALQWQSKDDALVIATPSENSSRVLATQPSITRLSRQVRSESLPIFYSQNVFEAPISRLDFSRLLHFVDCITSGPSQPEVQIQIQIRLLNRMACFEGLIHVVKAWRDLKHQSISLRVHRPWHELHDAQFIGEFEDPRQPRITDNVCEAFKIGEVLAASGDVGAEALKKAFGQFLDRAGGRKCECVPGSTSEVNCSTDYVAGDWQRRACS